MEDEAVEITKKSKVKLDLDETVTEDLLKPKKAKKATAKVPKVVVFETVKQVLDRQLLEITEETLKRPWMATKTFRLITDPQELQDWADLVLERTKLYRPCPSGELLPVVAVDTETTGLDTRIVNGEINIDIAGICLSSDGVEGLYVPITHEGCENMPRLAASRILQKLFDQSHLVFFNAKFDREVMRATMGIRFREFPYFEDVQVFNFLLDPKADIDQGSGGGMALAQGGLKALSKNHLDIEQVELAELVKVKLKVKNPETGKASTKTVHAPFNLVPTNLALWYAAGDAICTWLLWEKMYKKARKIEEPHEIDHELVDSLSWIERQRYTIDQTRLTKTIKWQQRKLESLRQKMIELSGVEDLNPGSSPQVGKILFETKGFKPYKLSEKTGIPSTDGETMEELKKRHPDDEFIKTLMEYKEYAALHPENLRVEPRDGTARVFLKQCTVAGGRLAANGGDFEKDGGFGLNIQAIKAIGGNKWVKGRILLEDIEDIDMESLPEYEVKDLHNSCLDKEGKPLKGILKNHIASYLGYTMCLVPGCKHCKEKYHVLKENVKGDANEVLNLRSLFVAPPGGWTFFTIDYSNIEMRAAANASLEPKFVDEFLLGEGDFHSLTATLVFPEFSTTTDKVRKKTLRSMAKILNFALLYGGTEYSIYEQLKKEVPDMTMDKAREMVLAYWDGVPVFKSWVEKQRTLAQEELITYTGTGRLVRFDSAMKALRIHEPGPEDKENYWNYRKAKKKVSEFQEYLADLAFQDAPRHEREEVKDRIAMWEKRADAMWKDDSSGVKNYSEYNRFIGKIGRLSMNIPLQGIAGDFMRMSLNRIRKWAQADVGVEAVMRMHGSVHDEIDPSIKNEWVPYVLPRLTRLMRLRDYYAKNNFPVPIETDCEYGHSWDIDHHLTGDKDHAPGGYYDMDGMQGYIPMEWADEFDSLCERLETEESRAKLARGLRKSLHTRAGMPIDLLEKAANEVDAKKWLIISLQLDEYWRVDEGEDPYTLVEFEKFYGLTRPEMPIAGFLDPMPLELLAERDERIELERQSAECMGADVPPSLILSKEDQEKFVEAILNPPEPNEAMQRAMARRDELFGKPEPETDPVGIDTPEVAQEDEDDVFAEKPVRRKKADPIIAESEPEPEPVVAAQAPLGEDEVIIRVKYNSSIQCLRFMDEEDLQAFLTLLGRGNKSIKVAYCGEIYEIPNVATTKVPEGFSYSLDDLERIEDGTDPRVEQFSIED